MNSFYSCLVTTFVCLLLIAFSSRYFIHQSPLSRCCSSYASHSPGGADLHGNDELTNLPQITCSSLYLIDKFSSVSTLITHLFVFIRGNRRLARFFMGLPTPAYPELNCPSSSPSASSSLSTSIFATRLPPHTPVTLFLVAEIL